MIPYTISEIILLILIYINKLFLKKELLLDIFTLLPITVTTTYIFIKRNQTSSNNNILFYGILFLILGDIAFITEYKVFGIYFFSIMQLNYFFYLNKTLNKKLIFYIQVINLIICLFFKEKVLFLEASFYALITLLNTIKAHFLSKKKQISKILHLSFICLLLCDTNLALIFITKPLIINILENIFFILEWFFYISFQILITLYFLHNIKIDKPKEK